MCPTDKLFLPKYKSINNIRKRNSTLSIVTKQQSTVNRGQ